MSKPKRRCPACGSTNLADAASCCVCGFVFAATVGSEMAAVHPPESPASEPDALETPAGDGASTQHSTIIDSVHQANSQARAVEVGALPEQRPDHAAVHRRGMISLTAFLALAALSAIGLAVFRSVAEEGASTLSVRPTATTMPHLGVTSEARNADLLMPTETALPSPMPTETPLPLPTPTETPLPSPTPLPIPTEVMLPSPVPMDALTPSPTEPPTSVTTYKVRQGDTCWEIANRFGISIEQLIAQNRLSVQCVIRPGQVLTIRR